MPFPSSLVSAALCAPCWLGAPLALAPPQAPQQQTLTPAQVRDAASALIAQRRFQEAEARLGEHLRRAPKDHLAWNLAGIAQFSQKRYHAAAESFAKCDQHGPADAFVRTNLGAAQFLSERIDEARTSFERTLEIDSTNSRARLFLARIAERAGDAATAEKEFRAAVDSPAPDPVALFHFGVFLLAERRHGESKAALERALALDPNYGSAHNTLGLVLQRMGDKAGAQRHLERFKELTEINIGGERRQMRVSALVRASYRELEDGNVEAALSTALEALDEGPQFAVVHQTVSDLYRRMGRTAEAEAAARRAAELTAQANEAARRASGGGQ
jgi:Tfp pilus assembly protein PilF